MVAWVNAGSPQGNPADMPALPGMAEGWMIGKPDVVIEMPVDFEIPANTTLSSSERSISAEAVEHVAQPSAVQHVEQAHDLADPAADDG